MGFLLFLLWLALRFGPQLFFEHMVYEVGKSRPPLSLTGHDVARRLLEDAGITDISVVDEPPEAPAFDDHYDMEKRIVSLSPAVAQARSAVAYAIAAHEVGHALQHASDPQKFDTLVVLKKASVYSTWLLLPVLGLALALPGENSFLLGAVLVFVVGIDLVVRLMSIPFEWDASFGRGLPLLLGTGLLPDSEVPLVRRTLFAAATTYISFALVGLLVVAIVVWG
jgi:hypothetical protein